MTSVLFTDTGIAYRLPEGPSEPTVLDLRGIPFTKAGSCHEHADRDRNAIERLSPFSRQSCDEHEQKARPLVHKVAPRRKIAFVDLEAGKERLALASLSNRRVPRRTLKSCCRNNVRVLLSGVERG